MNDRTFKQYAMLLLAACDRPDGDAYERHVVRLAHQWLRLMNSPTTTQGRVNTLMEALDGPRPDGYGCLWDDLREGVIHWARAEGWLES